MSVAHRDLRLLVLPLVASSALQVHDRACGGVYKAEVPAELTDAQAHTSIMDSFHRAHALHRPDDFIYQIWDAERQIDPPSFPVASQFISLIKEPRAAG